MSRRSRGRLILPWEEKRNRMPKSVKIFLFVVAAIAFFAVLVNRCSVPDVQAGGWQDSIYWSERQSKALESIADSLKKIERKWK